MAEIEIEKKKPVWPWILLVLVILAILYFLFFDDNDNVDDTDVITTEQVDTTVWEDDMNNDENLNDDWMNDTLDYTGAGVAGFSEYIADEAQMGVDHEYTSTALLYLIDAVREKASEQSVDIDTELQQINEKARKITENPEATDHAGTIKEVGSQIVEVLRKIKQEKFPNLSEEEVTQVETAVEKIDPAVLTLQQKDNINNFFSEAADVLEKME